MHSTECIQYTIISHLAYICSTSNWTQSTGCDINSIQFVKAHTLVVTMILGTPCISHPACNCSTLILYIIGCITMTNHQHSIYFFKECIDSYDDFRGTLYKSSCVHLFHLKFRIILQTLEQAFSNGSPQAKSGPQQGTDKREMGKKLKSVKIFEKMQKNQNGHREKEY